MLEIIPIDTPSLDDRSYLAHDGEVAIVVDPPQSSHLRRPRVHAGLRLDHGLRVGRNRVARLMRSAGLQGCPPSPPAGPDASRPAGQPGAGPARPRVHRRRARRCVDGRHHLHPDLGRLAVPVAAVVILFSLVGSGAGILLGTLFRNEQQAAGISLLLGLGLGALGGCMVPLEVFSTTMKRVAHITPQAWGNDAFAKLVGHGASITGILPQLGVLAAFAVVLLALASWRLRRVLVA